MTPLIRCEGIWKIYRRSRSSEIVALSDINMSVHKGSITVIKGPSGSGKTTLISIIGTIERPTKGTVYIEDRALTELSDIALSRLRRRRIGIVFQDFNLMPRLSAWENVSYPLIPEGIKTYERKKRACELLEMLGLEGRYDHTPEELSGGEKQRVAIARALINNPDILILDEPTSNIDSKTAMEIIDLIRKLRMDGKSILICTHDGQLLSDADHIYTLHKGKIIDDS